MREKELAKLLKKLAIRVDREEDGWFITYCCFTWRHKGGRDTTPSLGIKIEPEGRSGYHCWSCHSKGSLANLCFELARHQEDDTLRKLGRKIEIDEILGSDEIDFPEWGERGKVSKAEEDRVKVVLPSEYEEFGRYPSALDSDRTIRYCRGRGIYIDTMLEAGLRYDPKQQRLLFPVWDYWTGSFAGFTGRICWGEKKRLREQERRQRQFDNPKYKIPKIRDYAGLTKRGVLLSRAPARSEPRQQQRLLRLLRGDTVFRTWERVILVEGLFAYLRLTQLGYENVVAILGSELTIEKADILRDIGKAVYWFTDNDLAGQQCMYGTFDHEREEFEGNGGLSLLYGDVPQFIVEWPEGKSDPDQLTREEIDFMINNADFYAKGMRLAA